MAGSDLAKAREMKIFAESCGCAECQKVIFLWNIIERVGSSNG